VLGISNLSQVSLGTSMSNFVKACIIKYFSSILFNTF
jgi:hypothetical protein